MKPAWRIYYEDGTTFDSLAGAPEDAPADGVICIVMRWDGVRRPIANRADRNGPEANSPAVGENWYFWHGEAEEWWGCDREGLFDQLKRHPRTTRAVKQGVSVSRERFQAIMEVATVDPDFPVVGR